MKATQAEIERRMTYAPPTANTIPRHEKVNGTLTAAALIINDVCPAGRNLALALTALEDAHFRANAAIAQDTPDAER